MQFTIFFTIATFTIEFFQNFIFFLLLGWKGQVRHVFKELTKSEQRKKNLHC